MISPSKKFGATLSSLFLAFVLCYYPTLSSGETINPIGEPHQTTCALVRPSQGYEFICMNKISFENFFSPNHFGNALETDQRDSELDLEKKAPIDLKEILSKYYKGSKFVCEQRAYKRVMRWKEDFENIAKHYTHVDWKILSAIVKVETQGRTGRQVSRAKAVGMPQIKYQGAWAFLWDAMFSKKLKHGSRLVKDYYNANIRARYGKQLNRIRQYLEEKAILVHPASSSKSSLSYRQARSKSWKNLKTYLRRRFKPGEYQVAVDIAAMYIDHLVDTFHKIKEQVADIKQHMEHKAITALDDIEFSGTKKLRWNSIKTRLVKNVEWTGNVNVHALTLSHLTRILNRLQDPNIYSAAYNFGLRKVLEYAESGKKLPRAIVQYVKKVTIYNTVFSEIERLRVYT